MVTQTTGHYSLPASGVLSARPFPHSCAQVGSQLDHDSDQIYAPVYLSALGTICREDAFEAANPAAGKSLQEEGHSPLPSHTRSSLWERGTSSGWGSGMSLAHGSLGSGKTCGVWVVPEGTRSPEVQIIREDNPRASLSPPLAAHRRQDTVTTLEPRQDETFLQHLLLPGRGGGC